MGLLIPLCHYEHAAVAPAVLISSHHFPRPLPDTIAATIRSADRDRSTLARNVDFQGQATDGEEAVLEIVDVRVSSPKRSSFSIARNRGSERRLSKVCKTRRNRSIESRAWHAFCSHSSAKSVWP